MNRSSKKNMKKVEGSGTGSWWRRFHRGYRLKNEHNKWYHSSSPTQEPLCFTPLLHTSALFSLSGGKREYKNIHPFCFTSCNKTSQGDWCGADLEEINLGLFLNNHDLEQWASGAPPLFYSTSTFFSIKCIFSFFFFKHVKRWMRCLPSYWLWFDFAPELAASSRAASQCHCGQFGRRRVEGGPMTALRLCDRSDLLLSAWCIANIVVWLPIDFSSRCSQLRALCVCVCLNISIFLISFSFHIIVSRSQT